MDTVIKHDETRNIFRRWRGSATIAGVCLLLALTTLNVRAQTPSNTIPAPPGATGVAHPATPAPATQSSGAVAEPVPQAQDQAPADDSTIFVFKKEVQEVMLHATVVD